MANGKWVWMSSPRSGCSRWCVPQIKNQFQCVWYDNDEWNHEQYRPLQPLLMTSIFHSREYTYEHIQTNLLIYFILLQKQNNIFFALWMFCIIAFVNVFFLFFKTNGKYSKQTHTHRTKQPCKTIWFSYVTLKQKQWLKSRLKTTNQKPGQNQKWVKNQRNQNNYR